MNTLNDILEKVKKSGLMIVLGVFSFYFAINAIKGDRGFFKYLYLKGKVEAAQAERETENYVCSSLVKSGFTPYYWESKGIAELDFIVQDKEGNIIPIEVKSGEHTRSKSLNVFRNSYKIPYSIRISTKNFGYENNIKSIPLYSVFCLDELAK